MYLHVNRNHIYHSWDPWISQIQVNQSHGLGQLPVDGDAEAQFGHHASESTDHRCELVRKALLGVEVGEGTF